MGSPRPTGSDSVQRSDGGPGRFLSRQEATSTYAQATSLGLPLGGGPALRTRLDQGLEPCILQNLGDSTSYAATTGIQQGWAWLAARYPAFTAWRRTWDDTNQCYGLWETPLQIGTAGEAYVTLPGTSGNYVLGQDYAAARIVGDIEIGAKISPTAWVPATANVILAKYGAAGNRGYYLRLETNGKLNLTWSTDATATVSAFSTIAPTITNGTALWVKATLQVSNGQGGYTATFYTSPDGQTWTTLGSPVVLTTGGATSIYASTSPLELGSRGGGTTEMFAGNIYCAWVRSGIGGTVVASPKMDMQASYAASGATFLDGEGHTWTLGGTATVTGAKAIAVYNAGAPGQAAAYFTNSTRLAKMLAPGEPGLAVIDLSHNEGSTSDYTATYDGLCQQVLTTWPLAPLACFTQNPRKSPAVANNQHAVRNRQIASNAAAKRYGLIDVYTAFLASGNATGLVQSSDGIHPVTPDGYALWFAVFKAWLLASLHQAV